MKKFKILLCFCLLFVLTGCGAKYKEGTYNASFEENYDGQINTVTAKLVVNEKGKIESVYLDSTYTTSNGILTTKKNLGSNYGMKSVSANMGKIKGGAEWFEQVNSLEKAVVDKQGIDFIKLNDDGKTDSVTGCTIKISGLYNVLEDVIKQAKK